ncbi:GNAT family N-acetyltransferase [Lysobacter cavernae]|uniref:GNAT family N-acetyltransferase n=1 Tax=Lysobacter cavernae TaxID=1685901 RepID=A0ABV7RMA3_9GAMM
MALHVRAVVTRRATPTDAAAISALTLALTRRWIAPDCTQEGAGLLLASMGTQPTLARIQSGYRYLVAEQGTVLLGVAALQLPHHLYHLFVADAAQHQGLARRLWDALRDTDHHAMQPAGYTVNAARHSIAAYRRLGFVAEGPEQATQGIPSTPMRWRGQIDIR